LWLFRDLKGEYHFSFSSELYSALSDCFAPLHSGSNFKLKLELDSAWHFSYSDALRHLGVDCSDEAKRVRSKIKSACDRLP